MVHSTHVQEGIHMKTNYHTHTKRCLHAAGTEEDYVRAALEAGVSILGFSDHAPFPDRDFGYRMQYSELEEYFSTVDRLAKAYSTEITIKKSLEIEYLPQYRPYYELLWQQHKPDYLIVGEHLYYDAAGKIYNYAQMPDTASYLDYAKALAEAMKTGYFQIAAHPDVFAQNYFAWDRNCDAAVDIILDAAAQTNTILEFNANGLRRGIRDYPDGRRNMYPHMNFWRKVSGSGLRVIIGSDCHEPWQVWDDCMLRSYQMINEMSIVPMESLEEL